MAAATAKIHYEFERFKGGEGEEYASRMVNHGMQDVCVLGNSDTVAYMRSLYNAGKMLRA